MALPTFNNGKEINEEEWNAHVTEINRLLDKPYTRYYQAAAQTIPAGSDTPAVFDTALHTHPEVDVVNNDTFYMRRAGVWAVHAAVRYAGSSGTGERYASINMTGSVVTSSDNTYPGTGSGVVAPSMIRRFNVDEFVWLNLFQTSGGPLDTQPVGFGESVFLSLAWLAP